MKEVLLSVVMPVYNRKEFVVEMIYSIIAQTLTDWELLAVDDGSDDGVIEELEKIANIDRRISLLRRDRLPKGAQTCRNIGMLKARGQYIMILDSDDYLPNYCFEQRVSYLRNHPELDFAVFPYVSFNVEPWDKPHGMCGGVDIDGDDLSRFVYGCVPFVVWNNIYRRDSLVNNNRMWDERIKSLQDADFNMQCILAGMKYEYASGAKVDYFFRTGGSNKSRISKKICTKDHFESHLYYLKKIFLTIPNNWQKTHKSVMRWCIVHKFLIGIDNWDNDYVAGLLKIADEYHAGGCLRIKFGVFKFLKNSFGISQKILSNTIFPLYRRQIRKDSRNRRIVINNIGK